jgi:hypothetical protein
MENQTHERFFSANQELRNFLRRAQGLVKRREIVSEEELDTISQCHQNLSPEVGDASRSGTLDASLQGEIAEYVRNLRALQGALEKARSVMLARRMQLEAKKRRTDGPQGWVHVRPQTT